MDRITTGDGLVITVYRVGFRKGYYAEATDLAGRRLAFTGAFRGRGSRQMAIDAATSRARQARKEG